MDKGLFARGSALYWMLKKFRANEYDLIHTHTPFTIGFVGLRWAESHEVPIVATYHTLYDRYAHYIPLFPEGTLGSSSPNTPASITTGCAT